MQRSKLRDLQRLAVGVQLLRWPTQGDVWSPHFSQPLLCEVGSAAKPQRRTSPPPEVRPRELLLRDAVDEALRMTNGNLSEAARRLGMARSTLYRILHRDPRHSASD